MNMPFVFLRENPRQHSAVFSCLTALKKGCGFEPDCQTSLKALSRRLLRSLTRKVYDTRLLCRSVCNTVVPLLPNYFP